MLYFLFSHDVNSCIIFYYCFVQILLYLYFIVFIAVWYLYYNKIKQNLITDKNRWYGIFTKSKEDFGWIGFNNQNEEKPVFFGIPKNHQQYSVHRASVFHWYIWIKYYNSCTHGSLKVKRNTGWIFNSFRFRFQECNAKFETDFLDKLVK